MADTLPPLPEPVAHIRFSSSWRGGSCILFASPTRFPTAKAAYTADQMRAYAAAAAAAVAAECESLCDELDLCNQLKREYQDQVAVATELAAQYGAERQKAQAIAPVNCLWRRNGHATCPASMPPTAPAVPLTAEQISEMAVQEEFLLICDGLEALTGIVRATERAHGIGQEGGAA